MIDKEEIIRKRIEDLQTIIASAERLERLSKNDDFQFFLNKVRNKQRQYDNILHNPRQIGFVTRKSVNVSGAIQYMDFKYTTEDDNARIKDAQLRFDTFERVIKLVDDFNEEAKRAVVEIEKLKQPKK